MTLKQAKSLALQSGQTLSQVVNDALRLRVAQVSTPRPNTKVKIPSWPPEGTPPELRGLHPGYTSDSLEDQLRLEDDLAGLGTK